MNFPDSEFWNFSQRVYALPDVEETCLRLQNNYDADINIALYCLWLAENTTTLEQEDIDLLIKATEPWQQTILKPLRDARKMMKQQIIAMPNDMLDKTANNISEIEINAEHMSQLALEKTININQDNQTENRSTIECANINLHLYLQQLKSISSDSDLTTELSNLLNAVFQDPEAVQVALMNQA